MTDPITPNAAPPSDVEEETKVLNIDDFDGAGMVPEAAGSIYPYWSPEISCAYCKATIDNDASQCKKPECRRARAAAIANDDPMSYRIGVIGNKFYATVIDVDAADPTFVRYILQSHARMKCYRGDIENQEEVIVNPGEAFTVSAYSALQLHRFNGIRIFVAVKGKRRLPSTHMIWEWELKVDKSVATLLNERRQQLAQEIQRTAMQRMVSVLNQKRLAAKPAPVVDYTTGEVHDPAASRF